MKDLSQLDGVKLKIFVVEKQSFFRIGICSLIDMEQGLEVIGNSDTLDALLKQRGVVDLCVIDYESISDEFFIYNKKAKEKFSNTKFIITAFNPSVELQIKFFKMGVSGVFDKNLGSSLFIRAVKAVLYGDLWFERKILISLANDHRIIEVKNNCSGKIQDKILTLTQREKCIVCYAIQGLPAKRIAQKLSVQEKTVRNQLTSIYQKLDVSGQVELCLKASELTPVLAFNKIS